MNYKNAVSIVLVAALGFGGAIVGAQGKTSAKLPELYLNVPVTDENSVRVDVGGAVLRIPNFLTNQNSFSADRKKLIEVPFIGFTFWYPDMTMTCFGRFCKDETSETDQRFKVYVTSIVYISDQKKDQRPRPSAIFDYHLKTIGSPKILDSRHPGLIILDFTEAILNGNPELKNYSPQTSSISHLYANKMGGAYELWMHCTDHQCKGIEYEKERRLCVHFFFNRVTEATIDRTDNIIRDLNRIISAWATR